MNRFYYFLALLLLVSTMLGAQSFKDIATVRLSKTEYIKAQDFEKQLAEIEAKIKQKLGVDDRKKVLDKMVNDILFMQAAEDEKIFVGDDEVTAYLKQMYGVEKEADLQKAALAAGSNLAELVVKARPIVVANSYIKKKKPNLAQLKPEVADSEIQKRYNAEIQSFLAPAMSRFQEVFIVTAGKSVEDKAKVRVRMENFSKAIKTTGKAAFDLLYTKSGPDKEYIARETIVFAGQPAYAQALGETFLSNLFEVKKGTLSALLESNQGLHLVYVIEKQDAKLYGLDETIPGDQITGREQIRQVLFLEKLNEAYQNAKNDVIADLRKRADITIDAKYKW